ncbi:MAG: type IV secretory system conjugative DNA transfer family protein [Planctomycetes bacterium]|nr:type IV secretory system conjugative DNA transfer family protein [Planctomycetota bacterium]
MLKLLTTPATNDRSPRYMERALAAIHQSHRVSEPITFIYGSTAGRVGLFVQCADGLEEIVAGPITANYPNCTLATVEKDDELPPGWETWTAELELVPEIYPILRHAQFEDLLNHTFADPVSAILRAVKPEEGIRCAVEIHLVPAGRRRCRAAQHALRLLDREFFRHHHRLAELFAEHITRRRTWLLAWVLGLLARTTPHPIRTTLDTSASRLHDREENLQAGSDKIGGHLFETHILLITNAAPDASALAIDRLRQLAGALGAFTQSRLARFHLGSIRRGKPSSPRGKGSLMSHEEIATLFHPPTAAVAAEQMQTMEFRELEPPPNFLSGTEPGSVILGRALFRGDARTIGMDADARRRHLYVVGSTGAGKSTLLLNLIHQDMIAGRGLTVIDVHGDLAASVIERVPKNRTNDAIIFDAAAEHVVPFNPLSCPDPSRMDTVVSDVVSAFKKLNDSWGPRLENLLRCSIFMAVEQNGTFMETLRVLTDKAYRDTAIVQLSDEVVRAFWQGEFASWSASYRTEAIASVTNKLMPFLTSRQLRAIMSGSAKQSLNLRHVMDEQKILIVNLSRGRLGQDNSTLLGSLLLTAIEQTAMTRADIPEAQRRDHFLYLDEFQSLTTPSTATMLSESRKYRLCLTLSHQLTRQLDPATYQSVIGNCGTLLSFRIGMEDAELLAPAMSKHPGQLLPADLCNLPNYTVYARLLIDGEPSRPFSLRTLPSKDIMDSERAEIIRRTSKHRYARPASFKGVAQCL